MKSLSLGAWFPYRTVSDLPRSDEFDNAHPPLTASVAAGLESAWSNSHVPHPPLQNGPASDNGAADLTRTAFRAPDTGRVYWIDDNGTGTLSDDLLDYRLRTDDLVVKLLTGNDTVYGGTGNDTFSLWDWGDVIDGGAGVDGVAFDREHSSAGVRVDLNVTTRQDIGGGQSVTLLNIENFTGTWGPDTLIGSAADNVLADGSYGSMYGPADDLLVGNGGNDTLLSAGGNDTLDGGAGEDVADFHQAEEGVTVDLTIAGPQPVDDGNVVLIGIEDLIGTWYGDRLIGNGADNVLNGRIGNDTLIGGDGSDTAQYSDFEGVAVDLTVEGPQNTGEGLDVLTGIENLTGGDGNDLFTGNAAENRLKGNAGMDTLRGGGGNDILDGGAGADRLDGGSGDDTYLVDSPGDVVIEAAGAGQDVVKASVSFALSHGAAVEVLTAAGASAIDLTGNEFANTLFGNGAANVLDGGAGADRLDGGAGDDRLFGDAGKDTVSGGSGNDIVGGGSGKDKLYGGKGKFSRDLFVFDTKLKSAKAAKAHTDKIYDFGPKYDSLGFDDAVFKNKTIAKYVKKKHGATLDHKLKIDKHWFRVGDKALDKNDFFIYNDRTHKLYFDADGSGHKAMVEVASFSHFEKHAGTHLTHKDFFLI